MDEGLDRPVEQEAKGTKVTEACEGMRGWIASKACDRPKATCPASLASGARAGSITLVQPIFRETELLPAFAPPAQALLRSQSVPRAAAWRGTVPSKAGTTMLPDRLLIALRLPPLPVAQGRWTQLDEQHVHL